VSAPLTKPTFDLQTALSAMADYPEMLRRLGVIRVIEVDLAGSGIDLTAGDVKVSANPSWDFALPDAQVHTTPVVVPAHLSPSRFALTEDGRIDPESASLGIAEIDTDSAAMRHVDLARQVVNAEVANAAAAADDPDRLPPVTVPDQLSLPSLRNAGLSLFQGDRASDLRDKLVRNSGLLTATSEHELADAAHAVTGLVVDVWDDVTHQWRTLCARRGTYELPGGRSFTLDDLGAVSLAATARRDAIDISRMYLHQSLLRWTGWSLVAPPPGQPVTTESAGSELSPPDEGGLPGFEVTFVPKPGTLPALRFGRGYRFQLRTMDAAGGVDPLNPRSTDFSRSIPAPPDPPVRFLRFEPVVAPIVVATAPMTEGESLETLVFRPTGGVSGIVSKLLGPLLAIQPVRHIAPPKVSELLCEHHGMLDTRSGVPDAKKYKMIAERDRANLAEVGKPDPRQPAPAEGPDRRPRYVSATDLPVTWLPDPISRGAALSGLPEGLRTIDFERPASHTWPALRSFRLQVADGGPRSAWSTGQRLLTVYVPRGEMMQLRLSSSLYEPDLALLGHLAWLAESGARAATIAAAHDDAVNGRAWQITPYRSITLVNAVRVPVTRPNIVALSPAEPVTRRAPGSTKQDLVLSAKLHRPSTGQLALAATWTDPIDDPGDPAGPTTRTSAASPPVAVLGGTPMPHLDIAYDPDPVTGDRQELASTHVFGDTKRHQVKYSVVGTTRYMEHFVQRGKVPLGTSPFPLSSMGIVPGTDAVRSVDGATTYRRDIDYVVDYQRGTMARVTTGTIPAGATVEVAIVAQPVSSTSDQRLLDVPSTARPAPPQIGWVVPTFGWTDASTSRGLVRTRTRSGGGLRIFLDRPWYSSGVGEQLAVVLADRPVALDDEQLNAVVTRLAGDPIVVSASPAPYPTDDQFPLATARPAHPLSLPELEGRTTANTVTIAPHDVVWDAERKRWACDIVLPPGKIYQPFIRLALARYQPNSIAGVELSAVAPVEWAQLSPDRAAAVALDAKDPTKVTVTVSGRSAGGTVAAPGQPNVVSAIVQSAAVRKPTDLDWTTVGPVDGQVLPPSPQSDGTTVWSGVLKLPKSRTSNSFRLVITEREQYGGGGRLVYSDVLPI
jgi:hypothetical protein